MDIHKLSKIIESAQGKIKSDKVIKNVKVVNPISATIVEGDIAIVEDYIVGVGEYSGVEEIDGKGYYATSGLIDAHVHIESSLCTPKTFGEIVLPTGTTMIITDPHEIVNVSGIDGLNFMINSSKQTALKCLFMLSSCVPATENEESGYILDSKEVQRLITDNNIFGLAEMMNFHGLLNLDEDVLLKLVHSINANKVIDGHGVTLRGKSLNAYKASGVTTDHECTTKEDLIERVHCGMYVLLRNGSAAQNLKNLLPAVNLRNYRRCCMCTDDKHLDDIIKYGHISHNIKIAVESGFDEFCAIAMATINTAECYGLKDIGLVAPGYKADIVLWDSLKDFNANTVLVNGEVVVRDSIHIYKNKDNIDTGLDKVSNSINIPNITTDDLQIKMKSNKANIISIVDGDLVTKKVVREVSVNSFGNFEYDSSKDILKVVAVERHKATGHIGLGLIENYKLKNGAVATSISHDAHNIIACGDNDDDIVLAIKEIERNGGGITAIKNGKVLHSLKLNISGIITDSSSDYIIDSIHKLHSLAYDELNINRNIDPFMTLSFMALSVIPELKLTTKGLFDVLQNKFLEVSL